MTMLKFFGLFILVCSAPAWAIENLFSHCEASLLPMPVGPNQIVVQGYMDHHWETGMEDQTGWTVSDEQLRLKIIPNPYVYFRWLREGDQVYLLNADGSIRVSGIYGETREPREVNILGRKVTTAPNRPVLYADAQKSQVILDEDAFARLFFERAPALIVQTLEAKEKAKLAEVLAPYHRAYLKQLSNPDRFVRINDDVSFELAYFQRAIHARVVLEDFLAPTQIFDSVSGRLREAPPTPTIRFRFQTDDSLYTSEYGDSLYLLDGAGQVLWSGELEFSAGSFTRGERQDLYDALTKAANAVVITAKERL
jgi:hypothetical protein